MNIILALTTIFMSLACMPFIYLLAKVVWTM